ncbi:hypothetical protein I552_0618 [Mycobacterium xenopi 3993]|nr:hypothetical protein I552_0618 [Mycobacterium xenopi 3993]
MPSAWPTWLHLARKAGNHLVIGLDHGEAQLCGVPAVDAAARPIRRA